jgi:hypothetical protein
VEGRTCRRERLIEESRLLARCSGAEGKREQYIPGIGLDIRLDDSVRHCARSVEEDGPERPLESQLIGSQGEGEDNVEK